MPEIGNSSVFSQTDSSNNTSTDPGWPEGMAPSRVNGAARALQGAITRDYQWRGPTVTAGGTANAITLTYSVAPAAYYTGQVFTFKAGATNTGATTVNVNSLGAKNLYVDAAACVGGEIISGKWYVIGYDGTQFQLLSPAATSHGKLIGVQVFTASGTATYTPTAGTNSVVVEVVGAGGGGGGAAAPAGGQCSMGGAGGAGGYAKKRITASFSGVTVTVGAKGTGGTAGANNGTAGGTSSFGALISATGGSLGQGGSAAASPVLQAKIGNNGAGSSGDINSGGIPGTMGFAAGTSSGFVKSGNGGSSLYGNGGVGADGTAAGTAATGYGSGGSGGACLASASAQAGGNGSDGIVIVWEYA